MFDDNPQLSTAPRGRRVPALRAAPAGENPTQPNPRSLV
jgi:hypothetical protein